MNFHKHKKRFFFHLISSPIIYSGIIPFVICDIFFEVYHRTCFPLYGIPYVKRREYIKIDRHRLSYLSGLEKFNCMYCGYGNGLLAYISKIAAETENYWCGIKHKKENDPGQIFYPPQHHKDFLEYGDEKGLNEVRGS